MLTDQYGFTAVGAKNGKVLLASETLIAQVGIKEIRRMAGLTRGFPVQVDLSGHYVMVEADSHKEAVQKYLLSGAKP